MLTDEDAIRRCIQIGRNGLGSTRPNPMVGAIIVHNYHIIAEGFTSEYGGPHAEVNALKKVMNEELLPKSTLYVTLEPCSHYGKTPPCSDLIIKKKIGRVVIGCLDDNPQVAGKGIARMEKAGISVKVGVLEQECKEHHKRFFTFFNKKRPYIILKWAESADGYIAPLKRNKKEPVWITNTFSRQLVHKWRAEEQAILVGHNTVIEDNPSLTLRDWSGKNPTRVILSNKLSQQDFRIFNSEANTFMFNRDVESLMHELFDKNINSVIIEGGSNTLQLFIDANLWDEARVFLGPVTFGNGISAPKFESNGSQSIMIKSDVLKLHYND